MQAAQELKTMFDELSVKCEEQQKVKDVLEREIEHLITK